MADRVTRFGVSLPRSLMEELDCALQIRGIKTRSKAIRDSLSEFLRQNRWASKEGRFTATISYLYDHHKGRTTEKLTSIQHEFGHTIKAAMHSHISHEKCVEVLIAEGTYDELKKISDGISSVKEVEACKTSILGTAGEEE
jgi:CopG family nickel-responsive transcriptional regulator